MSPGENGQAAPNIFFRDIHTRELENKVTSGFSFIFSHEVFTLCSDKKRRRDTEKRERERDIVYILLNLIFTTRAHDSRILYSDILMNKILHLACCILLNKIRNTLERKEA